MRGVKTYSVIAALTVALGGSGAVAVAADTAGNEATPSSGLEEIVVSAQRVEENLQRVPIAVTAFSEKDLEDRGVKSLLDVSNYTPNLVTGVRGAGGVGTGQITIRGIGLAAPDSSPAVGIYIDEVYYPSEFGSLLGLFDLQRIEVLRGPQGTLFGRNTIAGAIQFISVQPSTEKIGGFVEASGGSRDSYDYSGALNLPITDTLAVRISGKKAEQGGYVHAFTTDTDLGRDISRQERVQLRWTPTDQLSADLKVEGLDSRTNGRPTTVGAFNFENGLYLLTTGRLPPGAPGLPPFLQSPNKGPPIVDGPTSYSTAGYNGPDFFQEHFVTTNGTLAYQILDNLKIKSISAYNWTNTHLYTDFDNTPIAILDIDRGIDTIDLFTQELQLSGSNIADKLHWTVGGFYYDSRENVAGYGLTVALTPPADQPTTSVKDISKAAYGQATYDIIGGFAASAGVRYSIEDITGSYPDGTLSPGPGIPPPPTPDVPTRKFRDTSPYFGLNWQIDPDTLLYLKASKGFRAGGVHLNTTYTAVPGNPNYEPGALYFNPETAWNYEFGGRFTFMNRRLVVNPTIFQTNWKNIQFNNIDIYPGNNIIAATRNAGNARLRGFELESQYALTDRIQLFGTYSFLDARYTHLDPSLLVPSGTTTPVVLNIDDPLQRSPKNKYSLGGQYKQPFANGSDGIFRLDYAYTSAQRSNTDGNQSETIPSYGLLNARIEYHPANINLELALYGTNLLGKYYLLDTINFQTSQGNLADTPGRPREGGVSAKYTF